jgi:murein DD-endopeptidase MepM/ murein hydrolase activator NlpD
MNTATELDQRLLLYLDEQYGYLEPWGVSPEDSFYGEGEAEHLLPASLLPLDRLQLLALHAPPPWTSVRQSFPYRSTGHAYLRSVRTPPTVSSPSGNSPVLGMSHHADLLFQMGPAFWAFKRPDAPDPYERDPSQHRGFSHLPKWAQALYHVLGSLRVFSAYLTLSSKNSYMQRFGPVLLIAIGTLLSFSPLVSGSDPSTAARGSQPVADSIQSAPDQAKKPDTSSASVASPDNRSRRGGSVSKAWKDSVRRALGFVRLKAAQTAFIHIPARPPVPDSSLRVSSEFGHRSDPISGEVSLHAGVDLAAPQGTPITAPSKGVVAEIDRSRRSGLFLRLDHAPLQYKSSFSHLSETLVQVGDTVSLRDTIATVGSSGRVTGPHLHFRVEEEDRSRNPSDVYQKYLTLRDSFQVRASRSARRLLRLRDSTRSSRKRAYLDRLFRQLKAKTERLVTERSGSVSPGR